MPELRSLPAADTLAARLRVARRARRDRTESPERGARELVLIAFAVPVVTLVIAVVVVLAVLVMAGSPISGTASAVATCWLAINQVPITISGVTVGILPLLPTLLVGGATAAMVAAGCRDRARNSELTAVVCAAIGGPLLVSAIALAVVMDGSSVLPVQSPDPLVAFAMTFLVQGVAALGGIAIGRSEVLTSGLSAADRRGITYGCAATLALVAAGGVVVLLRLLLRFDTMGDLIGQGHDFDGYLGLTTLSILYLPNLMIGCAAILVGSRAHLGPASADLFGVHGTSVPPLPALAIWPSGSASWAVVGLVVPMLVAGFVAWRCRSADPMTAARTIGIVGAVAATTMIALGWFAGGNLGEIGDAGVTVVTAGVFTLGWILGAGLVVALINTVLPGVRPQRRAAGDSGWLDDPDWDEDAQSALDYDDEYLTDEYETDEYLTDEYATDEYATDEDESAYDTDFDPAESELDPLDDGAHSVDDGEVPVSAPRIDPDDAECDPADDWQATVNR